MINILQGNQNSNCQVTVIDYFGLGFLRMMTTLNGKDRLAGSETFSLKLSCIFISRRNMF